MKRWIFYIGQFSSISEWHRLFLIRSGTDMTAIRYSEESGGDVILCWVWRMIVAIKYKCSRIYGETKPNVLTNHSGWSILCLRISLLMILHKRRISVTFSMSFNVNDYIYKNVVYAIHFFFFFVILDISSAMIVQSGRKLEISLYFSSHMKQCVQSLLWICFMPCIFLMLLMISTIISKR